MAALGRHYTEIQIRVSTKIGVSQNAILQTSKTCNFKLKAQFHQRIDAILHAGNKKENLNNKDTDTHFQGGNACVGSWYGVGGGVWVNRFTS